MKAISEFVNVENQAIHLQLPKDFKAKRVQVIVLPVQDAVQTKSASQLLRLKGSIKGQPSESLDIHLKTVRDEW